MVISIFNKKLFHIRFVYQVLPKTKYKAAISNKYYYNMEKFTYCLLLIFIFSFDIDAQNFTNGFNFYLPADDTTLSEFMPAFPAKAITSNDPVSINPNGNFSVNGKQIKFWGTNLTTNGAFPDKSKAWYVAGRLRNFGFNLIRFHHIDNPWSNGSLFVQGSDTRHFNPVTLDKMEYLLNELKKNGIYANINLHVGRTFNTKDGVVNADSIVDFGKGVTLFDPQLISLQKEYAKQLLTHINPYTGLSLVDDPVMAIVEITNENSLYRMWRDNKLKSRSQNGSLIMRHIQMLDELWIDFLKNKYSTTENLKNVWNIGITSAEQSNLILNGNFETPPITQRWNLELHNGASASMIMDFANPFTGNFSGKVAVTSVTGTIWHIQFKQAGFTGYADSNYTLKFSARADGNKNVTVTLMRDNDPYTFYDSQTFQLTSGWNTYEFSFSPSEDNNHHMRLSFQFENTGNYWFDEVSIKITTVKGLEELESLENKSVKRTNYFDSFSYSDQRVKDISEFYIKIQNDYNKTMLSYLKDSLGVKCPIVATNWSVGAGDLASQSTADFIDNHSYWDHPNFPNIPWSSTDWNISNTPMVLSNDGGTIPNLFAGTALLNKPYTISEYNHAFPNRYQSESVLFLAAYSSFHGADGIMFFDYNGSTDWTTDFVDSYFAIHRNSALMGLIPSCAYAYRNSFIAKANETIKLNFKSEDIYLLPKFDEGNWQGSILYPKKLALKYSVRNESFYSQTTTDFSQLPAEPVRPYRTDTDEIVYNTNGLLTVSTAKFSGISGKLDNFPNTAAGNLILKSATGFGTLTWVSNNDDSLSVSHKSLLSLSTQTQNTRMIWDGTATIHNNWGNNPTQLYPIKAVVNLKIFADSIIVYPLSGSGNVVQGFAKTYLPIQSNIFSVILDQQVDHTLWYGIEKFGDGIASAIEDEKDSPINFEIKQNYPNPFNGYTTFNYSIGTNTNLDISIYDILGSKIKTLYNNQQKAGRFSISWNGKTDTGVDVVSGVYFTRFVTANFTSTIKIILIK